MKHVISNEVLPTLQWLINKQGTSIAETRGYWYFSPANFGGYCDKFRDMIKIKQWNFLKSVLESTKIERKRRFIDSDDNLVLLPSLNGVLLVNCSQKYVAKIINRKYESNYLNNELVASKSLPDNTPEMINHGTKGKYFYIVSKFVARDRKVRWNTWGDVLSKITPLIKQTYLSNRILKFSSETYLRRIQNELENLHSSKRYLNREFSESGKLLKKCLTKYSVKGHKIYKVFSHGDLVPNNVIVKGGKYYICDWASGGIQNYFYDLFVQDFYFTSKPVWKNFDRVDFYKKNQDSIFFGWSKDYINIFNKHLGIKIGNDEVRFSIILSLAEKSIKSYLRYQDKKDHTLGEGVFNNISKICRAILNQ